MTHARPISALHFAALLAAPLLALPGAAAETDEKPKWDVSEPGGPLHEIPLDTDEGTWMSLDVSPDGREIVFDLLGDIYVVPIDGGDARALTSGIAWDMQPRYSPDGRRIAFTSDRGGGDNVWVMERDGSAPSPVTSESLRLLNSPAWSPDGDYIAARKHFTASRSLGAGEIWLYHRAGGEGVRLTERPNDQKDAGEPAFSPDGRYVYFSQDTTPGDVFEYNKDPNGQIYEIRRLDRETGELVDLVGGPGGAVRPTPSPDGTRLAFVRRVRAHSVLFVRELDSGRERRLWDGLDRDMQETWAIHGVYPAMAWTPDSRGLVVWAGGKIRRVDAETGAASVIPFRVRAAKRIADAVRFPVEVAPARFPVRMLRWVSVSPQGDRVVYEALGRLWIRDLPDGRPRRLTSQEDHFELYPDWSRDGSHVVYTTWDDEALGSVRVVSAGGGEGRTLTARPGHYLEPAFSPDGATVVFRRAEGGHVTSPLWSGDPGLYALPASGGEAVRFAKRGRAPHFGAESRRVYFVRPAEKDSRELVSVELDGSDERVQYASEEATEMRVSPDGRWLAFREGFEVWLTPFTRAGHEIAVGPKSKAIPVAKASAEAGEYLHWSGDSSRLYWSLGPELFHRDLRDSFAFLAGAPEPLPEPPAAGRDVSFEAQADVPSGRLAIVGGRVVSMRGDEVVEDGVVVIEGNRIAAVGPRDEVEVPGDARVVDAAGHTVLPGLVDVHWHGAMGRDEIVPQRNWYLYAALAFGVTTIHDPSNDTSTIFAASEMQRAGRITGPRIFSTGTILYGAGGDFRAEIDSLEDARFHMKRMKAVGAFTVKSYNQPRRDQRQQVLAAARELGLMVVPEGGSLFAHNMTMVVDGHTGIEHSLPVAAVYDDVLQLWSKSEVGYTPTFVVSYGGLMGELWWYQHTNVWENERLLAFVPRDLVDARSRRRPMAPEEEYNHFAVARVAKQLSEVGVSVQIGAHGQREGLGAHWEIWMLEQGGFSPHQSLRAATLDGAAYLGLDGDIGSIETGKLADLVVVDGNPLEDLRSSERVTYTILNGRLYDAATMDQVGNHPETRGRFWWEEPR